MRNRTIVKRLKFHAWRVLLGIVAKSVRGKKQSLNTLALLHFSRFLYFYHKKRYSTVPWCRAGTILCSNDTAEHHCT